ncbi:LysR family transcriptional regulator [Serratia ureilytica]
MRVATTFHGGGQQLGISASASRLIAGWRNGSSVRLFHRSTRTVNLTPEGPCSGERCRRI